MSMFTRYILFIVAVIVQASGIALVVKSLLGTSPISSLPYVISLASPFTLGQMTFAINMLMVLGQYLLLRSAFDNIQFLQIPVTLISALITGTIARFFLNHLGKVNEAGVLVFHPHL